MLERGTWLVPTLVAPQGVIDAAEAGTVFSPGVVEKARWGRRRPPRRGPAGDRGGGPHRDGNRLRR